MNTAEGWERRPGYLMSAVGAHVLIRFTELLAPMGLQPYQFGVLRQLAVSEGATQQELADAVRRRRAAMVGLLDDLEAKGLVERRRHPHDRRANALHLTPAGRRVITKVSAAAALVEEELLSPLDPAARQAFLDGLLAVAGVAGVADGVHPKVAEDDQPPSAGSTASSTGHAVPARRSRTDRKA